MKPKLYNSIFVTLLAIVMIAQAGAMLVLKFSILSDTDEIAYQLSDTEPAEKNAENELKEKSEIVIDTYYGYINPAFSYVRQFQNPDKVQKWMDLPLSVLTPPPNC